MVDAAVILAGGGGRRLGGVDKPALVLAGRSLLRTALDAVPAPIVVVVGPMRDLPKSVVQVREDPPGSGPAAALAVGLRAVAAALTSGAPGDPRADRATVAVLAADLPGITSATVERLLAALHPGGPTDPPAPVGAVLVDADGRRQYLSGVFRLRPLLAAVGADDWTGRPIRALLDPLIGVEVPAFGAEADDVDTAEQYRRLGFTAQAKGDDDGGTATDVGSPEPATSFSDVTHDGVVSCNGTTTRTRRSR